ncbi:MAG: hypothetical protein WBA11_16495 [Rubrivirga sp.]
MIHLRQGPPGVLEVGEVDHAAAREDAIYRARRDLKTSGRGPR